MKNGIIVFALLVLAFSSCKREAPLSPLPANQAIPTLSYPIASFASVTKFFPFGDTLIGNPANKGYQIILSDTTSRILAACSGVVTSITPMGNGNNTVILTYQGNSVYSLIYTGIGKVQVHLNDSLTAGAVLGIIVPNGLISFSLVKSNSTVFCPATLGSSDFNTSIQVAINRSNTVNPEDSIVSPCITDSLIF